MSRGQLGASVACHVSCVDRDLSPCDSQRPPPSWSECSLGPKRLLTKRPWPMSALLFCCIPTECIECTGKRASIGHGDDLRVGTPRHETRPSRRWAVVSMRNRIGTVHGVREFRGEARNKQKWIVRAQHRQRRGTGGRGSEQPGERERKRAS